MSVSASTSTYSRWRIGRVGARSPTRRRRVSRARRPRAARSTSRTEHDVHGVMWRTPPARQPTIAPTSRRATSSSASRSMPSRVEDRDHEDRADVVDDREREQEQLQRRIDPRCRAAPRTPTAIAMSVAIGMPQPSCGSGPAGDGEVEQRGNDHPAERGDRRQRGATRIAELAFDDLALDLEPDDEEEERHQTFVDPAAQRERQRAIAETDREVGGPERAYPAFQGEFAHTSATTVAATRTTPPALSVRRKSSSGRISRGDSGCLRRLHSSVIGSSGGVTRLAGVPLAMRLTRL